MSFASTLATFSPLGPLHEAPPNSQIYSSIASFLPFTSPSSSTTSSSSKIPKSKTKTKLNKLVKSSSKSSSPPQSPSATFCDEDPFKYEAPPAYHEVMKESIKIVITDEDVARMDEERLEREMCGLAL